MNNAMKSITYNQYAICSIYMLTNKVNGKVYIGQTWSTLAERIVKHKNGRACRKLKNATKKYGWGNFEATILSTTANQERADWLESYYIAEFNSIKNGYNLRSGGSRGKQSEESKAKISASLMGHEVTAEAREKQSQKQKEWCKTNGNRFQGRKHSDETKAKLRAARAKQVMKPSEETKRKIAEGMKRWHAKKAV